MQSIEALHYLGILNHSKDSSKCWLKTSQMGVNKLTSLKKTMAGKGGFKSRLTNHSMRKRSMLQKLNDNKLLMLFQHTSCSSQVTTICKV